MDGWMDHGEGRESRGEGGREEGREGLLVITVDSIAAV